MKSMAGWRGQSGSRHAGGEGNHLRAGSASGFLVASILNRSELRSLFQKQGTDAARPVELVSSQRERSGTELAKVDRDLADRLHRVDVKRHVVLVAKSREQHQVLHDSRFVVSEDDRRQFQIVNGQ